MSEGPVGASSADQEIPDSVGVPWQAGSYGYYELSKWYPPRVTETPFPVGLPLPLSLTADLWHGSRVPNRPDLIMCNTLRHQAGQGFPATTPLAANLDGG